MPVTICQLLIQLEQPPIGVALINETIVPRENWETHFINDGDIFFSSKQLQGLIC